MLHPIVHVVRNNTLSFADAAIVAGHSHHNDNTTSNTTPYSLGDILSTFCTLSILWKLLFFLLLAGNLKNLPLIWHLRIVNAFRFCLRSQRPKAAPTPDQLFQPLITASQCPLMEIDFNFHKTNSSYFSDIDIARTHLICTLFSPGIEVMRGGTGAITGSKAPVFSVALGAVSCSFKRELKPYESYELWTRVLTWDEKWFYLLTHFVRKGTARPKGYSLYPEQNRQQKGKGSGSDGEGKDIKDGIVATALSKCVFKQGRKTITPDYMLRLSGLLPTELLASQPDVLPASASVKGEKEQELLSLVLENEVQTMSESDKIEAQRRRGMEIAITLAAQGQQALEDEFAGDEEALGRHRDGTGLTGVVSTLCQLAHLKKDQSL